MTTIENETFRIEFDPSTGAIVSMLVKPLGEDLLGEKRLAMAFNLRLQHPDYECDYAVENRPAVLRIEGTAAEIRYDGVRTERGLFPVSLRLRIALDGAAVRFTSRLENRAAVPVAEFWYPCLGGITRFGDLADTECFWPGYTGAHYGSQLSRFPTALTLGERTPEAVMMFLKPPWPSMPWFDVYNRKLDRGLYFGYHDPVHRVHANRFGYHPGPGPNRPGMNWPTPDMLGTDDPIGVVFSHVRFPYVGRGDFKAGETYEPGEFVIQYHEGDWHDAAPIYRNWFDRHFTVPREPSWLRRKTCWLNTMLLQPEDRVNTDYAGVLEWAKDAKDYGINTVEICAWDKGGQDRDYPEYVPDERLGGEAGFRKLLAELDAAGIDPVIFANYNAINCETDLYREKLHRLRRMDEFGNSENWMHWGQSTIQARHALSVRRQIWASASIPEFNELIAGYFLRLAEWGVKALQLDKTGASEQLLDFNPLATLPPDTSMPEGTVRACEQLLRKLRQVRPDFVFASEAASDRFAPFIDVYYRATTTRGVGVMRYVFPEWTSCLHVGSPWDFAGVNAAVRFGCVIAVEPVCYKASPHHPYYRELMAYIREINRLREELKEWIFLARWLDDRGAELVCEGQAICGRNAGAADAAGGIAALASELPAAVEGALLSFSTHERFDDGRRAIVVVNETDEPRRYRWRFTHAAVGQAVLHEPFQEQRVVGAGEELIIPPRRLHILLEAKAN